MKNNKYTQQEVEFLDKCAIAAMQAIMLESGARMSDKAEYSYIMAEWMLKARKEALK